MRMGGQVVFDEQNLIYSNFIPDLVHIQWPEALYRWRSLISTDRSGLNQLERQLKMYKTNGCKIIYTVHNILPHDNPDTFDQSVYELVISYADIFVHHGHASVDIIQETFPPSKEGKHIVAPHGPYNKTDIPNSIFARRDFDLPNDRMIITNFGFNRSYKGLAFGHDVFESWRPDDACFFTIGDLVGDAKPLDSTSNYCSKRIYRRIHESEIDKVIAATDLFFLTHSSGLNSGLISLALTYSKPVVFPDIGNFRDQVYGWNAFETYDVNNVYSAQSALQKMIHSIRHSDSFLLDNTNWLKFNSWDAHVKLIIDAVRDL